GRGRGAFARRLGRYGHTIGSGRRSQDATDDGRRKPGRVEGDGEHRNGRIGEGGFGEGAATSLLAVAEEQQCGLHAIGTERSGQAKGGREIARVTIEVRGLGGRGERLGAGRDARWSRDDARVAGEDDGADEVARPEGSLDSRDRSRP